MADLAMSPAVLRLRTHARAAHYNPDLPHDLTALAVTAGVYRDDLAAQLTGRTPLTWKTRVRLARTLGLTAPGDSDPDMNEALRRARRIRPAAVTR